MKSMGVPALVVCYSTGDLQVEGHNMPASYPLAPSQVWVFSRVMPFPAVRIVEYVSVAQQLSTSVSSLRFSSIFEVAVVSS